jgi:hypothetical protein
MHPFAQITSILLVSEDMFCSTWAPFLVPALLSGFLYTLLFRSETKDTGDSRMEIAMAAQNGIRIYLVSRGPNTTVGSIMLA